MTSLQEAVDDFLAQENIAVTGVSRTREDAANLIFRRLMETGHQVFPVNPNAVTIDNQPCYPDLKSIPAKIDAVVIVNKPQIAEQICHECADIGVSRVWMHRSMEMLGGSVSEPAVDFCRQNGIKVIPGGCPMMFCGKVDFGHKMMRWMLSITRKLPKEV
jgi:predicted CoA-binding protein